jgi:hypothetical protein
MIPDGERNTDRANRSMVDVRNDGKVEHHGLSKRAKNIVTSSVPVYVGSKKLPPNQDISSIGQDDRSQ